MPTRGRPKKEAACGTCRIRRVKCDETKPECQRCTSTGRKCDGYPTPDDALIPNPIRPFASDQEARSFTYFSERTSLEISSHYDETFWQSLVLQLSHVNTGIRHIVIAIGSLHESRKGIAWTNDKPHLPLTQMSFSLEQCNKAISLLTQQDGEEIGAGILIASCILFMAFELLQNRLDATLNQFRVATRMLQSWNARLSHTASASERELVEKHLCPILNRFGESSNSSALTSTASSLAEDSTKLSEESLALPPVFFSLGQARTSLHAILDHIFLTFRQTRFNQHTERSNFYSHYEPFLRLWYGKFQQFIEGLSVDVSDLNKRRICLLNIQYLVSSISFASSVFKDEMLYDSYIARFEEIVSLCTSIIEIETGGAFTDSIPSIYFCFDLSIITPLFFTVCRCREPTVRRRALKLLQSCPRREGLWLSNIAGLVGEQIMQIEERQLDVRSCGDIPLTYRVQLSYMHYDPHPIGEQDQQMWYQPVLQLVWSWFDSDSRLTTPHNQTIQLPRTPDCSAGLRPYWVVTEHLAEISHWKMLFAKKIFGEHKPMPDSGAIVQEQSSGSQMI